MADSDGANGTRQTPASELSTEVELELARVVDAEQTTKDRLKLIRAKRRFLEGLTQLLSGEGNCGEIWVFLRDKDPELRKIQAGGGSIPGFVDDLRERLREHLESVREAWPTDFPAALELRELQPDRSSQHPTYTFLDGFVRAEVNERALEVAVSTRNGGTRRLPLDTSRVAAHLQETLARLLNRDLDHDLVLDRLYATYLATVEAEDAELGEDQRLLRILKETQRAYELLGDELLIDLGRLVRQGNLSIQGRTLRLGHTRRDKDGVLVPGFEAGGYLGFIAFREDEEAP